MKFYRRPRLIAASAAVAISLSSGFALAADFYKGKTINMVIGVTVGGGYDQYARTIAQYIDSHIPGKPTIVVKNMPGASSFIAANAVYGSLPQDGTVIGGFQRELPLVPLLYPDTMKARFEVDKFNWLGSPQKETGLLLIHKESGVRTLDDLKKIEVVMSSSTPGTSSSLYPRVLNEVLGMKFKVVEGYKGSTASLFALEKKEALGHASGGSSAALRSRIKPWLDSGNIKVMMLLGFDKDKQFTDVPVVFDLVKAPDDLKMLRVVFTPQLMGRPLALGPKVPPDRVAILRAAFDATMKDAGFLKTAAERKMEIDPVSGKEINDILAEVKSMPPALLARLRKIAQ
ncbi:MAG: hypothetical protein RLZ98_197 [Pseudomonadota bacterium]